MRSFFLHCSFFILIIASSCSELGRQPPQWRSGAFSSDGNYYALLYSVFNVTYYSREGGMTHRSGPTTFYLQVFECATGQPLLKSPKTFKKHMRIADVDNRYVWLTSFDPEDDKHEILLFDIADGDLKFGEGELAKRNPSITFGYDRFYTNTTGRTGLVYEAADGRKYVIDPESGNFAMVDGLADARFPMKDEDGYQTSNHAQGLIVRGGGTRKRLAKQVDGNQSVQSADDFIQPEFLVLDHREHVHHPEAARYAGSFFVLSSALTHTTSAFILSRIADDTLNTVWNISLPQELHPDNSGSGNKYRFCLKGDELYVANLSHLMAINLEQGAIIREVKFF